MSETERHTFFFLFRTDKGLIGRSTWWRGTVPLTTLAVVGTMIWVILRPYAHHDLAQEQFLAPMTILAYAYLILFAFAVLLIAICEYNLSAKRFRARGRPASLAGLLPLSLLVGSAAIWFIPRSFDSLPDWSAPVIVALMTAVALWNAIELGVLNDRPSS
ncbi:hypothetical protein LGH83_18730 [Lichenihabitans sp. PAMC28606]|uniref:hypothetical protein n=1 Tax=Lichenihabitans sp. PAMC28606 TaxID=2880932 RepID=UPI001D0A8D18|nr:hypothetical protein [Lichenihabitans sp. PAMC28606]UDL94508.1 hypothetical protein LGH83_18730 [Lichenihabitans sp. PAMC28606]